MAFAPLATIDTQQRRRALKPAHGRALRAVVRSAHFVMAQARVAAHWLGQLPPASMQPTAGIRLICRQNAHIRRRRHSFPAGHTTRLFMLDVQRAGALRDALP